jgi:hydrogenase nickel incorporation protein HypA/HybF
MHEFSLMANLLTKIDNLAREQRAEKIVGVKVRLGALAHISPDHFRHHFVDGTRGTKVEGAHLEIETSDDINDPHAQDILLESIDVA